MDFKFNNFQKNLILKNIYPIHVFYIQFNINYIYYFTIKHIVIKGYRLNSQIKKKIILMIN